MSRQKDQRCRSQQMVTFTVRVYDALLVFQVFVHTDENRIECESSTTIILHFFHTLGVSVYGKHLFIFDQGERELLTWDLLEISY